MCFKKYPKLMDFIEKTIINSVGFKLYICLQFLNQLKPSQDFSSEIINSYLYIIYSINSKEKMIRNNAASAFVYL